MYCTSSLHKHITVVVDLGSCVRKETLVSRVSPTMNRMSPTYFSFCIDDVAMGLKQKATSGIKINGRTLLSIVSNASNQVFIQENCELAYE